MKLFILSFVLLAFKAQAFSTNLALVIKERGIPSITELRVDDYHTKVVQSEEFGPMTMSLEVYVTVTFSNACLAPKQIAKKVVLRDGIYHYSVYGVDQANKVCPAVYMPVVKTFLIDTIGFDADIPQISVGNSELD